MEEEVTEEIIEEDLPPPPPTFSEDELESAKAIAHEKGRLEGVKEEREKREESIKQILATISQNFSTLFVNEHERERIYEEEALKLGLALLDMLAPTLEKTLGNETLKSIILETLQHQSKQTEIRIEVAPDNISEIQEAINAIWSEGDTDAPPYKITGNNDLNDGGCNITWQDGGMIRDPVKTAKEIREKITALLENREKTEENNNSKLTSAKNNAINKSDNASKGNETTNTIADNTPSVSEQTAINGEDNE